MLSQSWQCDQVMLLQSSINVTSSFFPNLPVSVAKLPSTGSGLQGVSADPVVLLGGKACTLQDVSPTSVTCLSPASPTPIPAPLTVTILGVSMHGFSAVYSALSFFPKKAEVGIRESEISFCFHKIEKCFEFRN